MPQFVQSLEPRQLLSASTTLSVDEAKVALDVTGIIADAKSARSTLVPDGKAVAAQLGSLHLKNTALGRSLASTITAGRIKISADVKNIVSKGSALGQKVFSDWTKIQFTDAGNATKLAADQVKLATDVKALWAIEQPLIAKIESDIATTKTNVGNAVQAIVDANKGNTALNDNWTKLQGEINSSQQTLTADFSQLTVDVDALVAAL